jgi:hypothetical protein
MSSFFLDATSIEILMAVVGEPFMMIWKVQILKVFLLTSHGCEVFGKVGEALHMRQCLVPGLKVSSQATESVILDDCKGANPWRNKVNSLIEPLVSTKSKIFVNILLPLQLGRFEDILLSLLHLVLISSRSIWEHRPTCSFEEDETDGVIIFKHLWKPEI